MSVLYRVSLLTVFVLFLAGTAFGISGVRSYNWEAAPQGQMTSSAASITGTGYAADGWIYDRGIGTTNESSYETRVAPEDGIEMVAVPEPATALLFGLGALAYGAVRSRRRKL
jgi:hypothetical protein